MPAAMLLPVPGVRLRRPASRLRSVIQRCRAPQEKLLQYISSGSHTSVRSDKHRPAEVRWRDTDDRCRLVVHFYRAADDVLGPAKQVLPGAVAQDRRRVRGRIGRAPFVSV